MTWLKTRPIKPLIIKTPLKWSIIVSKGRWGFWDSGFLNFSFEPAKKWKRWPRKMKNWMRLFFLARMVRMFYGDISWTWFYHICALSLSDKLNVFFHFLKIFEFWLPMFLYWCGLASSLWLAEQWVLSGQINLNGLICKEIWKPVRIYDFVTINPTVWQFISIHITKIFYLGSKALFRWKCKSYKILYSKKWLTWAHFIFIPNYIYFNTKIFSLYWWKQPNPDKLRYYFSANFLHLAKYLTI